MRPSPEAWLDSPSMKRTRAPGVNSRYSHHIGPSGGRGRFG